MMAASVIYTECKEEERGGRVWGVLYAGQKMGWR